MAGNCFEVAIDVALVVEGRVRVVHGLPIGQGPKNLGKRFWHAWVEVHTGREWLVLDLANDRDIRMKRSDYYRVGQLDEEHVYRYTVQEAGRELSAHKHYGPWVESWEEMEEV